MDPGKIILRRKIMPEFIGPKGPKRELGWSMTYLCNGKIIVEAEPESNQLGIF